MTTHRPCTVAVHAGNHPDPATGAVAPPIHLATTFRHSPAGERIAGYEYQREGDPTNDRLREALVALEDGAAALTFAFVLGVSGLALLLTFTNELAAWLTLASLLGYAVVFLFASAAPVYFVWLTPELARAWPKPDGLPVTVVRGKDGRVVQAEKGQLFAEDVAELARWV